MEKSMNNFVHAPHHDFYSIFKGIKQLRATSESYIFVLVK